MGEKTYKIEISAKTIIFVIATLLLLKLVWVIQDLFLSLFIAFIFMSAAKPIIVFFENKQVPKKITTIILFPAIIILIILGFAWALPPLVSETALFFKHFPSIIATINTGGMVRIDPSIFNQYLPNATNQLFSFVQSFFSNLLFITTTVFFSVYLTLQEESLQKSLSVWLSKEQAQQWIRILEHTEKRLGAWLLGEVILMATIGTGTFIGLTILGIKYALPLSILAGLLEAVPTIGPVLSAVPAVIVAMTYSPVMGIIVAALYFLIQQLENHIIVPMVMNKVVGLNPIVSLIALIIGGRLFGVLGVILSIPTTILIETVTLEIIGKSKEKQK